MKKYKIYLIYLEKIQRNIVFTKQKMYICGVL